MSLSEDKHTSTTAFNSVGFFIHSSISALFCRALSSFVEMRMLLWWWEKRNMTIPRVFSELVQKHPEKVAFYFNKEQWTFAKV